MHDETKTQDACVFLDRDGVINARRLLLVRKPAHLRILDGVPEAIAKLNEAGYRVVVTTNQHPVGHGLIDEEDLDAIHARIQEAVEHAGGRVDAFLACTHPFGAECACSKPKPGMLEAATERFGFDPPSCWMVGDKPSDIEAGRRFGARTIWVTGSRFPWDRLRKAPDADRTVKTLPDAVEAILAAPTRATNPGGT